MCLREILKIMREEPELLLNKLELVSKCVIKTLNLANIK